MGIEHIREAVLSDAMKDAKSIVETAKKNVELLLDKKKREIDKEFERLYKAKTSAIVEEFNRRLIQFRGTAGKQVLEKRNRLIDAIFEKAKERILGLEEEKYGSLMTSILEKISQNSGGRIRVHRDDIEVFRKALSKINKARGADTKIVLDESSMLPERGGFIFVTDDYEVDQTLDLILMDIRKDILPFMAKGLFSFEGLR